MEQSSSFRLAAAGGALACIAAVLVGFGGLWRYAYTPGPDAIAAAEWPPVALTRDTSRPTLVMVLHPECGCSRASLEQLSRLIARTRTRAAVIVLFDVGPDALSPENDLWRLAIAIPGVRAIADSTGAQIRAFGARVSGQTFVYDRHGRLLFSGGMTAARGHAGDNDGAAAAEHAIVAGRVPLTRARVFGCLLRSGETES